MVGLEDCPEFTCAQVHVPGTQNTNLNFSSSCSRALRGDMQLLLHWSTFEATYRRIGYAFAAPEGQSGGCCNACSGNSCMVGNQRVRSGS
jgi:hypothetical protein